MQNGYNDCFQSVSALSSNSYFWGLGQNSFPETQAQSQSALFEKLQLFLFYAVLLIRKKGFNIISLFYISG